MTGKIDAVRFPFAARYAAGLPNAWGSFPESLAHTDTFDFVRRTHPELATVEGLPDELKRVVSGEDKREWIPEVIGCALFMVARDLIFADDEAFLKWCVDSAINTYNRPWARVLMYVLSPTLVVMGATKRWSSFHRGSVLATRPAAREHGRMVVRASLSFPSGLFNDLILRRWGVVYEAALIIAKASNPKVTLSDPSASSAVYSVTWDA